MSIIAEIETDSPIAQETLAAVPGMTAVVEDYRGQRDGTTKLVYWVTGDSFEAYEDSLDASALVEEYRLLAEVRDRRLYRLTLSCEGEAISTYSIVAELDIVILRLTATREAVHLRARFPARAELFAYRDACRERGVEFRLRRVYTEGEGDGADAEGNRNRFGVTPAQREALRRALEAGYFAVPRQTTLEAIAGDLGISKQALSTRLRRGQTNLVENALPPDEGADFPDGS